MKEQKKYQIEKVEHEILTTGMEMFFVVSYYPASELICQVGYSNEFIARMPHKFAYGMWRIKQQKLKQSKN